MSGNGREAAVIFFAVLVASIVSTFTANIGAHLF